MELFKANNQDQMNIIRQWIDESDVFLLILGGRYGSLDPATQKSYTHLEYEYALEKKMPIFTLILSDQMIKDKFTQSNRSMNDFREVKNKKKHAAFLKQVQSASIVRFLDSIYQIDSAIMSSLKDFESDINIEGWIRSTEISHVKSSNAYSIKLLEHEISQLRLENVSLKKSKSHPFTFNIDALDPSKSSEINRAIANAEYTTVYTREIRAYINLSEDYLYMIDILKNPHILALLSKGVTDPCDSKNVLELFVLNAIIPFLEQHRFVIQQINFKKKNMTIHVNDLGRNFFDVILN